MNVVVFGMKIRKITSSSGNGYYLDEITENIKNYYGQ
jgi:hypothetical protein